jgi:hypothetical protein
MQPMPQGHGRSLRVASVLLALLVLLAVVAFASRTGFGHASGTKPTPSYVSWAMSVFMILFVLMIPVAVYSYSIQMREFKVQNRRSMQARAFRSLGIMFLVFAFAGLAVYFRRHSNFFQLNRLLASQGGKGGKHGRLHDVAQNYHPTFQWPVLWVSLVLLAGVVGWYLWLRAHREPPPLAREERRVADDVAETIGEAIDDLESEPDARRAVIAAYARMENVLARNGLRRRASETPTEYLRRILLGLTTRVEAVRRLTALFEQAKFSDHAIDGRMKQEAIDALRAIRDDLQVATV